jgi:glycosyltransferase involved in cell wall biosynthesis
MIKAEVGPVHLNIAGSNPCEAVIGLACEDITVHGYVTDEQLLELYRRAACAIVPLRFGAGVKGKVLEAIKYGAPLVTTSVGAEGIPDAEQVMGIADEANDFANAVATKISQPNVSVQNRGAWLSTHFSREKALAEIEKLVLQH